jgi:hypothetical protein
MNSCTEYIEPFLKGYPEDQVVSYLIVYPLSEDLKKFQKENQNQDQILTFTTTIDHIPFYDDKRIFRRENWGVSNDAYSPNLYLEKNKDTERLVYVFVTFKQPPSEWYKKLCEKYNGKFDIRLKWKYKDENNYTYEPIPDLPEIEEIFDEDYSEDSSTSSDDDNDDMVYDYWY